MFMGCSEKNDHYNHNTVLCGMGDLFCSEGVFMGTRCVDTAVLLPVSGRLMPV